MTKTKNKALKKHKEIEADFDFSELMHQSYDDDVAIADVMSNLIEVSHNQTILAIELTKLAIENIDKDMNEDDVFSIFKKASIVIADSSPLNKWYEKFPVKN